MRLTEALWHMSDDPTKYVAGATEVVVPSLVVGGRFLGLRPFGRVHLGDREATDRQNLPRTRGDEPNAAPYAACRRRRSPHARG